MFGADRLARIAWAFVGLGIVIRAIRFLLELPALARRGLPRPQLSRSRLPGFAAGTGLWAGRAAALPVGAKDRRRGLRFFRIFAAALCLPRLDRQPAAVSPSAGRLLQGIARLMAIGTFAVAYPLIRYSAEAKPYGSDMLVTLVLLVLLIEWRRDRQKTRWLWALAVAMPVAVLLSYPAMFVVPAVSLAMLIELFRSGTRRQWLAWLGVNVAAVGGMALLFFASARAQLDAAGPHMRTGWEQAFPPCTRPSNGAVPLGKPHQRGLCLSGRRRAGRQFADDPLLPCGPGAAAPRAAILAGHALHRAAGIELHRRRAARLSLCGPFAGDALHGADLLSLDRPWAAAALLSADEEPPLVGRHAGGCGPGAPGGDWQHCFRSRFSQAV